MTQVVSKNRRLQPRQHQRLQCDDWRVVATPVAVYGFGHFGNNDHEREAGILSRGVHDRRRGCRTGLEAGFLARAARRGHSRGRFFQSSAGVDSSFPSSHSLIAWSAASALAAESSSRWTQFALYSGAAGVSLTRVMGQEHFPADVLVGSAFGMAHRPLRRPPPSPPAQGKASARKSSFLKSVENLAASYRSKFNTKNERAAHH